MQTVQGLVRRGGRRLEAVHRQIRRATRRRAQAARQSASGAAQAGRIYLLRDLHDLWLLVNESMMSLNVLEQAARALRDEDFLDALEHMQDRNERQRTWLKTRISQAAPQTLVVPV